MKMNNLSNKNIISIVVAILVGIVLAYSLNYFFNKKSRYVVLVFRDGNIYFGKPSWFPRPKLSNVHFLQVDKNGQILLQRFEDAAYTPENYIYFNTRELLFWTYLKNNSQISDVLSGKRIVNPNPSPNFNQQPNTNNSQNSNVQNLPSPNTEQQTNILEEPSINE